MDHTVDIQKTMEALFVLVLFQKLLANVWLSHDHLTQAIGSGIAAKAKAIEKNYLGYFKGSLNIVFYKKKKS